MSQVSVPVVIADSVDDINLHTHAPLKDMSVSPQSQSSQNFTPSMPVRKRKRKLSHGSDTDCVKWGTTEVGACLATEGQQIGGSHIEDLKEGIIDEHQLCNGEPELSTLAETKLRCASEQPCICSLCGLMIRQARNLRRHMLTSCPSRPVPDVEYQDETSEMYTPAIELLPNQSQENSFHKQSSLPAEFGLKFGSTNTDDASAVTSESAEQIL